MKLFTCLLRWSLLINFQNYKSDTYRFAHKVSLVLSNFGFNLVIVIHSFSITQEG